MFCPDQNKEDKEECGNEYFSLNKDNYHFQMFQVSGRLKLIKTIITIL